MAIAPVPTISFETVRSVTAFDDFAREGRILEARVTAMLSNTLARLSIDGRPIDVTTPKPLPIGATMTLKAELEGGQLRLVTQGPIRLAEGAAAGTADMPDTLLDPLKLIMAKVQSMAVDAAIGRQSAPPPPSASAAFATLADAASASQRMTGQLALGQTAAGPAGETGQPGAPTPVPLPGSRAADGAATQRPDGQQPTSTLPPSVAAMLAAQAGEDGAIPPVPPRLQALLLEAAMSQRATAGEQLFQAPAAKLPSTGLESLQAMLAEGAAADELLPQTRDVPLRSPAEARAAYLPPDTDVPDPAALANRIATAARDAAPEARAAAYAQMADAAQPQGAATDLSAAQTRAERAAIHFGFEIPAYFPGNPQPLRLEVSRDEAEGEEDGGKGKPRTWTIRFAAEAGPLGMIHAAITQTGNQVGVQLWAERSDTASLFKESMRDLQDSMEASNIRLEGLKIAEGHPEDDARGWHNAAAGPGQRREEIV
jgi:hypothetical protein